MQLDVNGIDNPSIIANSNADGHDVLHKKMRCIVIQPVNERKMIINAWRIFKTITIQTFEKYDFVSPNARL